jgi:hypothetical protein
MREPVFNETLQLGIVVGDLEATMRRYVDDYGIGPWEVYEFGAGTAEDFREYSQPVERSWRLAVATVGHVQWELIEPLDDESVYARFLAEKGEGVHHVAVATPDFDETVAQADRPPAAVPLKISMTTPRSRSVPRYATLAPPNSPLRITPFPR